MKTLNSFINEALIKKTSKISNISQGTKNLIDLIFDYLLIDKKYENDAKLIIENWLIDNKVKDVNFVADKETLNCIPEYVNKKHTDDLNLDLYNSDYMSVEDCAYKLTPCDNIYTLEKTSQLYIHKNMICHLFELGTIYCNKDETVK